MSASGIEVVLEVFGLGNIRYDPSEGLEYFSLFLPSVGLTHLLLSSHSRTVCLFGTVAVQPRDRDVGSSRYESLGCFSS